MPNNGMLAGSTKTAGWGFYQSLLVQNKRDLELSWQRCIAAGMDPSDRPELAEVTRDKLKSFYAGKAAHVRGLVLAEMRTLFKQLGRRGFTLTFANADSVILDRIPGDDIVSGRRRGDDLAPGNCWYEAARGTNAVGTAAESGHTIVVLGEDHFLRAYHDLICVAKPVFSADGDMVAILDATVHGRNGQMDLTELAYVLGLMHMSAEHIERDLFREQHQNSVVILTNSVSKSMPSGNAAFAFDESGRLENASGAAIRSFDDLAVRIGCHFEEIFRIDFSTLRKQIDQSPVDFLKIEDCKGRYHYSTVYFPQHNHDIVVESGTGARSLPAGTETVAAGTDAASGARAADAGFMCRDSVVVDALATVERATEYGAPILIRGETGTGKELLARYIHRYSGRSGELMAINCAAVPESLIEAELFGYEQGAFTGARRGGSSGLVRQADGGTLFLDEIGDMPHELQGRLLRLLDTWRVRPVGSERDYAVDVRLVTATNCDLEQAVANGNFRLDLLHRIKVVEVCLPALRERSDFDEIARVLLKEINPSAHLDDERLAELQALRWEGNMRELRNVLMRLLIRANGGPITRSVVKAELCLGGELGGMSEAKREFGCIDDDELATVFRGCRGNVAATARQLGVSRTTVYKHLRRLDNPEANSAGGSPKK